MEAFRTVFADHAVTWIVGLFFTAMTYLVNTAVRSIMKTQRLKQEAIKAESKEQDDIKNGLLALLRFRINRLCDAIKRNGYMTTDERYDLLDIFQAYKKLGGNGKTKMLVEYTLEKYQIADPMPSNDEEKDTNRFEGVH